MRTNKILFSLLALWLAIVSCNLPAAAPGEQPQNSIGSDQTETVPAPGGTASTETPGSPATATNTPPGPTLEPTLTQTFTPTPCIPLVVANSSVNVRSGPGTVYPAVGALAENASAPLAGKSADGTWWYIVYAGGTGGYGWVSGSVVTASCLPATVTVIPAPPTPRPPSGTCREGYVYRLARSSDKVCVPPASKAQAEADNAAAESRKIITVYGVNACVEGYVWREAYSGDYVCVTPAVRSQAQADNAVAATRWVVGAYGPHTCLAGFVWREAMVGDDVCVDPSVRTQAQNDNAAANSRKAINASGPDTCISGYVWREAFSGDHVCVTPAVKSQVAADNAAAPGNTWP